MSESDRMFNMSGREMHANILVPSTATIVAKKGITIREIKLINLNRLFVDFKI
jgi:hypothetical protein